MEERSCLLGSWHTSEPSPRMGLVFQQSRVGKLQSSLNLEGFASACRSDNGCQLATQPPTQLFPLTPEVAVESTYLPGTFHRDPADQIIVATARLLDCPLVTADSQIRSYPHVRLAPWLQLCHAIQPQTGVDRTS